MDIGTLVVLLVAVTIIGTLVWTWTSISREQDRQRRFARRTPYFSSIGHSDGIDDAILLPFVFSEDSTSSHSASAHHTFSNVHHDTASTSTTHSSHSHDGGGWLSSVFDGGSSDSGGDSGGDW